METKNQFIEYIFSVKSVTVATSSKDGKPSTHPVAHFNNGNYNRGFGYRDKVEF